MIGRMMPDPVGSSADALEIPFYRPYLGIEEMEAANRVIRSGWLTQGVEVEAFEKEAAAMLGAPEGHECVAVSSCTAGLYLLLKAYGIGEGSSVVVPNLTFAATINAVIATGATPIIEDVDENGVLKDSFVQERRNVAIQVEFGGRDGGLNDAEISFYDQAHSFAPGSYKPNSAWSFFPTKNITAGEGGLIGIYTNTAIRNMRDHGRVSTYDVEFPGSLNFRMTDLQAAILREQLKKLPQILANKRKISEIYRRELEGVVKLPPPGVTHLFWIQHPERDKIKAHLEAIGIQTSIHYKPLSEMDCYKKYVSGPMPVSEKIGRETLSLPFWPMLSDYQAMAIARNVKFYIEHPY